MKIIILTPNSEVLFTQQLKNKLKTAGEVSFIKDIQPIENIKELYESGSDKILAIDPDFCDWVVSNEELGKIHNLKAVCLQTTSFSWIDVDYLAKKGIPVMNLRGFSSIAVAEWATMMVLLVARKIPLVIKANWKQDYNQHRGMELRGKVAGVIGMGRIGTLIAENLSGLGMKVQYWSKESMNEKFEKVTLETLMATSDVIAPAVAKNEQTIGLITDEMINTMKSTAIFVSIVHEIYNHELLLEKAKKNEIYGYAFEESKADFQKYEGNVWAGPELGWCTDDSMRKNGEQWVESIVLASKGNYVTKVN